MRCPGSTARSIEFLFFHDAIDRTQRTVVLSSIQKNIESLGQTQINHVGTTKARGNFLSLRFAQGSFRARSQGCLRASSLGAPIFPFGILLPALIGFKAKTQTFAGLFQSGTSSMSGSDQRASFTAIRRADQLSFFPQIASAFFDNTKRAAVSARALSFRCNSYFSCLMRICS